MRQPNDISFYDSHNQKVTRGTRVKIITHLFNQSFNNKTGLVVWDKSNGMYRIAILVKSNRPPYKNRILDTFLNIYKFKKV